VIEWCQEIIPNSLGVRYVEADRELVAHRL
jgi:hypothetical protein